MLVTAIMPTRSRPALSETAVDCFLKQTYAPRQLLILDDEDDPSFPWADGFEFWNAPDVSLKYRKAPRATIGAKREALSSWADGEVIIHFDSDDWSAPNRITEQVELLKTSGKPLCGYNSMLFWDMRNSLGYLAGPYAKDFAIGTSMCYTKEFWQSHHWPDKRVASDNAVVAMAQKDGGVATLPGRQMCIARAHTDNTSSVSRIGNNAWPLMPRSEFPEAFFTAIQQEGGRC